MAIDRIRHLVEKRRRRDERARRRKEKRKMKRENRRCSDSGESTDEGEHDWRDLTRTTDGYSTSESSENEEGSQPIAQMPQMIPA